MQPSLPLFSSGTNDACGRRLHFDGLDGFLVGDVVKVAGLRGGFRCRAFFVDGALATAEVFGPLLDGRRGARVPAVRTFPLERLRPVRGGDPARRREASL